VAYVKACCICQAQSPLSHVPQTPGLQDDIHAVYAPGRLLFLQRKDPPRQQREALLQDAAERARLRKEAQRWAALHRSALCSTAACRGGCSSGVAELL